MARTAMCYGCAKTTIELRFGMGWLSLVLRRLVLVLAQAQAQAQVPVPVQAWL